MLWSGGGIFFGGANLSDNSYGKFQVLMQNCNGEWANMWKMWAGV